MLKHILPIYLYSCDLIKCDPESVTVDAQSLGVSNKNGHATLDHTTRESHMPIPIRHGFFREKQNVFSWC